MEKICVKCGHTNTHININPQAECPKCGVIYAKAEASNRIKQEKKRQTEGSSPGRSIFVKFLFLGGLACFIVYYYFGSGLHRENEEQAAKLTVEQADSPKPSSTVLKVSDPVGEEFSLRENEEEVGIQKRKASRSRTTQPTTPTGQKKVSSYLAESTISQGKNVTLTDHLSKDRFTVFFFYAEW